MKGEKMNNESGEEFPGQKKLFREFVSGLPSIEVELIFMCPKCMKTRPSGRKLHLNALNSTPRQRRRARDYQCEVEIDGRGCCWK